MKRSGSIGWRIAAGATLILAIGWIASIATVVAWGSRDQAASADAIVVLGAAQYDGHPSPVLRARLDHGIALWRRGLAPWLVLTGGTGSGDTTSEAAVSRRYAMRNGIPGDAILLETQGRTTSESIRGVATLLAGRHLHRVVLVSDPFHMLRLCIIAGRHGLAALTSPTVDSPISSNRREVIGYVLSESVKAPFALVTERQGQQAGRFR